MCNGIIIKRNPRLTSKQLRGQRVEGADRNAEVHVNATGAHKEAHALRHHRIQQQERQHHEEQLRTAKAQHGIANEMVDGGQRDDQRQFADHFGQVIGGQTVGARPTLFANHFSFGGNFTKENED